METAQRDPYKPLVSVVIPAHNEEKWIASCLESVLRDSYPHKEVIVVDDGSTDNTGEIVKSFPVVAIRNAKPVGPSSARNIGVREAKGEIIVFLDAHCIVNDSKWIQRFLQFFIEPEVGAVGGYFKREAREERQSLRPPLRIKVSPQRRLIKSANAAYRKAVFEQVGGFDPAMEWGGDAALTYKVHRAGWRVAHSRDIMVVHAEKIWSIKRAFLYGACYIPLLRRYPRETISKRFMLSSLGTGFILTLALAADLVFRFPVFTVSFVVFLSALNGAAHKVAILRAFADGFYTTIWSFVYYLGALYGGIQYLLQIPFSAREAV